LKGLQFEKPKALVFVLVLLTVSAGAIIWLSSLRIVLLPPVASEAPGATVLMRGLDLLPLVTDAGRICIDPDADVVTAAEVKICSNSVLVALSHHGHVVVRLPHLGLLASLAKN
jgi:hypothetical protein